MQVFFYDSFSSTTTASFGTTFYVGSINEGADDGITTFTYDYSMDLSTSFTGEDSLDVAIDIGGGDGVTATTSAACLLYTSPSPRDATLSRLPSSA